MKRFSNGFSALVSYTFGKTIDLVSDNDGAVILTNIFDPDYDRGLADYDVTHTLVASSLYELPFARQPLARRLAAERDRLLAQRARPQRHASRERCSRPGSGTTGPIWFGSDRRRRRSHHRPVVRPDGLLPRTEPTGTFGNIGRNTLRGPEIFNIDLSLMKHTRIGGLDTELRVETFNLLNHPQFGAPAR